MSAWVFVDLDGTLVNSAPGIFAALRHALAGVGAPEADDDALRLCVGPPLHESLGRLGVPEPHRARARDLYRAHYDDGGLFDALVFEGAHEMLERLRARGYRLALATAKPLPPAQRITAHFGFQPHFDAEFGPGLDGTLGDKRDLLAHAVKATGADPARSYMLGDRLHDALAASANGVAPIGALWGFGGREELAAHDVAHFAAAPLDVPPLVEDRA